MARNLDAVFIKTKAEKREKKKRPRMHINGKALKHGRQIGIIKIEKKLKQPSGYAFTGKLILDKYL